MSVLMKVGLAIFVAGLLSYFFHHSAILSAFISAIGFVLFVLGVIGWSLEEPGDISFS